jgi:hypothetical protein
MMPFTVIEEVNEKSNNLLEFMAAATEEMSRNYETIRRRSREDPGTAGDQGEEDWAELLRNWLPPIYQVVTKGRIVDSHGNASRQIDVLVLHPSYPKKLLGKKLYLAGGVLAAFECKVTLRPENIRPALEIASQTKELRWRSGQFGTPYKDLNCPIVFGLLSHSHDWQGGKPLAIEKIDDLLVKADRELVTHPKYMIDLVCVADLATWTPMKQGFFPCMHTAADWPTFSSPWGLTGALATSYMCHSAELEGQVENFSPIGATLSYLLQALAWEDKSIRDLAEYFVNTKFTTTSKGIQYRRWEIDVFSVPVREKLLTPRKSHISEGYFGDTIWNEWSTTFPL